MFLILGTALLKLVIRITNSDAIPLGKFSHVALRLTRICDSDDKFEVYDKFIYIVRMRRESSNKNAEFSQLVSAMGCPQEQKLFINIYCCLQI